MLLPISFGLFMESNCTKLLQAKGNMVTPMLAQVAGAAINLVFDPIFIFGLFGAPELRVGRRRDRNHHGTMGGDADHPQGCVPNL